MSKPYFPRVTGPVDCRQCERQATCPSAYLPNRTWRSLPVHMGRCPRLPDTFGAVDAGEAALYRATVAQVHARRGEDGEPLVKVHLPGDKIWRRLRWCRESGCWYFGKLQDGHIKWHEVRVEDGKDLEAVRRLLRFGIDQMFQADVRALPGHPARG